MTRHRTVMKRSEEFRHFLLSQYETACRKNSSFSLRAYALKLGIDSSTLSRLMKGDRKFTLEMFQTLSKKMGMPSFEKQNFLQEKTASASSHTSYQKISLDIFSAISDWYHFALIELVRTKNFRADAKWIAQRLGIPVNVAHSAIERLERLGWIVKSSKGKWIERAGNTTHADPEDRAEGHRKLQKQLSEKSLEALDKFSLDERDQSSMIVAVNPKRLEEVRKRVDTFRRELTDYLEKDKDRDSVYTLLISFFPLTKNLETGVKNHEN